MLFDSFKHAKDTTELEFRPDLASRHHFVMLPSGKVCRTLGAPKECNPVKGRKNCWVKPRAVAEIEWWQDR